MQGGDRNTTFFKAKASRRKERKFIEEIVKEDNTVVYDHEGIMSEFLNYFNSIFSSSYTHGNQVHWISVMKSINPRISDEMNSRLIEPYTMEEVRVALFQMHPDKAPVIDGFSALYQKFWQVIKENVCGKLLNFLNNDCLYTIIVTQLVLLPKKQNSVRVEDFRPISLCNVVMKLITKVLANRLCA